MKNILFVILLFISFSVFGQKWTLGVVPPTGTEQRINQTTQLRKGTKPNQFHITRADGSVIFMDQDTVAQILGIGAGSPVKYYTLNTVGDTSTYKALAQLNCPSLAVAKLDSCSISYLFMFNCLTGSWENFKTPNIKTATRTLYVDRSLGNNTKAKEECPTCQFEYPEDALAYAVAKGIENPSIHISADTFTWGLNGRTTYPTTTGLFDKHGGSVHFTQDKAGVLRINKNTGSPFSLLYRAGNNFNTDYYFDLGTLISDGQSSGKHFILLSTNTPGSNDELSSVYFKAKNIIFKHTDIPVPNYGFMGNILQCKSKNLIVDVDNIETDVAGFIIDGGINQNVSINVNNYIQTNARAGNSNFLYIRGGRLNSNVSFTCRNYQNKINYGYGVLLDLNVSPAIAESQTTGLNYKVKGYIDNYVRTDTTFFYPRKGTGTFDGFGSAAFITIWNRLSIPSTTTNIDYFIEANNVEEIYPIINNEYVGQTIVNSTIHLKINNAKSKSSCISLSGWTLVNSKIIIEGSYTSDSTKCVSIHDNSIDATSSITLKGKFKTTSPTLEAMEIGNNSGAGVNNIIINGQIITGGGFSIDNPAGTPISVKVMPGCASNVTTSANVTQLGTGIYVDPNFNN